MEENKSECFYGPDCIFCFREVYVLCCWLLSSVCWHLWCFTWHFVLVCLHTYGYLLSSATQASSSACLAGGQLFFIVMYRFGLSLLYCISVYYVVLIVVNCCNWTTLNFIMKLSC